VRASINVLELSIDERFLERFGAGLGHGGRSPRSDVAYRETE
jgi:hypothetical protein